MMNFPKPESQTGTLQKADILFDIDLPGDGEYVVLAKIFGNGKLTDERKFARSKVATMGSNAEYPIDESRITVYENYASAPLYSETEKIIAEIDLSGIDITKFNYLIYKYTGYSVLGLEKYYDFRNNARESFYIKDTLYYVSAMFDIIIEDTKFVIVTQKENENVFATYKEAFKSAMPYFKLV